MTDRKIIDVKATGFLSPGDPGKLCEDAVLMRPNLDIYGLFDGATQITEDLGKALPFTGGSYAAQIAKHTFATNGVRKTLDHCAVLAGDCIQRKMEELAVPLASPLDYWSTSCAVVKIFHPTPGRKGGLAIFQIGDSAIVNLDTGSAYFPEANHDGKELQKIRKLLKDNAKMSHEVAVRLTMSEMHQRRMLMNSKRVGGYGAIAPNINGSPHIWRKNIALPNPGEILNLGIFSDGMQLDPSTFSTTDTWTETAQFLRDYVKAHPSDNEEMMWYAALSALSLQIRANCLNDPRGILWPRFKLRGDDQTAIVLRITG